MFLSSSLVCVFGLLRLTGAWQNVSRSHFESVITKNDVALVAFVSPATESSKALESEWSLAATQSKQPLLSIDCTVETSLCTENDVVSVPAIRLFKSRKSADRYRGARKASEIVPYVRRSTLPIVSNLDSNNRASFKIIDEYVFIAYLAPDDTASKSLFESLAARNHHRFSFGLASDVRLAKAENVPVPSIVAYHQSEGGKEILSGDWQLKTLADFVERTTAPLIGELTRRNELKYLQAGKSLLYIFASASSERSHYQDMLKPLAKKYKDYINFVTIDAMEYAHMAPGLGLKDDSFPAVALLNPMFGQVFPFQAEKSGKEISLEVLEGWVLDIVGGKVKPWTSSNADGGNEGLRRDEL